MIEMASISAREIRRIKFKRNSDSNNDKSKYYNNYGSHSLNSKENSGGQNLSFTASGQYSKQPSLK